MTHIGWPWGMKDEKPLVPARWVGWAWDERRYHAESSSGPVVVETREEALVRRVRYAAAHPLKEG